MSALADPQATDLKACCAAVYGADLLPLLLGDAYHPGGQRLTRRLAGMLGLQPGMVAVDLASGTGATALLLAEEFGVSVVALELGPASSARAVRRVAASSAGRRVLAVLGDAEAPPLASASFGAVICECALCTFPDKAGALRQVARVLAPGGRLGIADVVATPGGLPPELSGLAAWIGCLAGALPASGYEALVAGAGLDPAGSEDHADALAEMIDALEGRLADLLQAGMLPTSVLDPARLSSVACAARQAVADGALGYRLFVAVKPA